MVCVIVCCVPPKSTQPIEMPLGVWTLYWTEARIPYAKGHFEDHTLACPDLPVIDVFNLIRYEVRAMRQLVSQITTDLSTVADYPLSRLIICYV